MQELSAHLTPGTRVRHPNQPNWGPGQVQSNIDGKITVNFQEKGKVVVNSEYVALELVFDT